MRTPSVLAFGVIVVGLATILLSQTGQSGDRLTVTIRDMGYHPAVIHIKTGETVTWVNRDHHDHTVVSDDEGLFKSGNIQSGQTFQHRFAHAGTFRYSCTYHPRMKGTVVVTH